MLRFFLRLALVTFLILSLFAALTWLLNQNVLTYEQIAARHHGQPVTEPVTIEDVLAADIPSPTLSKVDFPGFSYRQAFPEARDDAEVVIKQFGQAPMLEDMSAMPKRWRKHYPPTLPPVEQRLPQNPAVVRGPDGIGQYGGTWHRTQQTSFAWDRPIMYETFIRNDPAGRPQPGVAYRWEVNDNNRVFTFYMRKGHRWSDGHPFTSHDIAWICNKLIGSPYWPNAPFWMQARDGSAVIYLEDIRDYRQLVATILKQLDTAAPSPGRQLFATPTPNPAYTDEINIEMEVKKCARLTENQQKLKALLETIDALPAGQQPDELTRNNLVDLLNRILKNRNYYTPDAWQNIDLNSEPQQLEARGLSTLSKAEFARYILLLERNDMTRQIDTLKNHEHKVRRVFRLNTLLFRAAYPDLLLPAAQSRVRIEPVPDSQGDDSHIIRFTFPKPSSFFLEKTTTFMFYRGLFVIAPHHVKPFHPDGSDQLAPCDIYDWPGLARTLLAGRNGSPSPAAQLWRLLPEPIRARLSAAAESEGGLSEPDRRQIIEAVNQALTHPDFYDPALWQTIDFDAELAELMTREEGFNEIVTRHNDLRRVRELLLRADLRRRVHEHGIDSLNPTQRYQFNQAMFRAAFDDPTQKHGGLVAINREAGLNHQITTAPKPYESWLAKMHALRRNPYHPEENPHMPTLKAWRIITERAEVRSVAVRNPYYYRVDERGRQLPYLDAVETVREADKEARLLKIRSGAIDFQIAELQFQDYTALKQNEKDGGYEVRLWAGDSCGAIMLFSNYKHVDPMYASLNQDPRFRYALSSAINRQEIIDVVYDGLGTPAQFAVPKGSKYYNEKLATAYVDFNPDLANRLLDEMGLDKRDSEGTRLVPVPGQPGQPQQYRPLIYVMYTDERTVPIQAIQLICHYWQQVGINAKMKITAKLQYYSQLGLIDVAAQGNGGSYFGPLHAGIWAPTHSGEAAYWGGYVNYLRSNGQQGSEPPDWAMDRERVWNKVIYATNESQKIAAWQQLLNDNADMLPVIGVLTVPGKVVVVADHFKNVPKLALVGTIPHAPGSLCPEAFYIDRRTQREGASRSGK